MPGEYEVSEAVEHVEHTHELLERSEEALLRFVPLLAAILAIFAGLSSLFAGRLGEEALALKNEAVLAEVKAADTWSEYQAESLKAHLFEINAMTAAPKASAAMGMRAAKYRSEQAPLQEQARRSEAARDADLEEATATMGRKVKFDVALAFFEVAIVLTSIAAMIKRKELFYLAGVGGAAGLFFSLQGIFRAH